MHTGNLMVGVLHIVWSSLPLASGLVKLHNAFLHCSLRLPRHISPQHFPPSNSSLLASELYFFFLLG